MIQVKSCRKTDRARCWFTQNTRYSQCCRIRTALSTTMAFSRSVASQDGVIQHHCFFQVSHLSGWELSNTMAFSRSVNCQDRSYPPPWLFPGKSLVRMGVIHYCVLFQVSRLSPVTVYSRCEWLLHKKDCCEESGNFTVSGLWRAVTLCWLIDWLARPESHAAGLMFCECYFHHLLCQQSPCRPVISECTEPVFTKFSGYVHIWVGMINPTFSAIAYGTLLL